MNEDEHKDEDPTPASEETPTEEQPLETEVPSDEKDIDFDKHLEELNKTIPPKRTPLEKAVYAGKQIIKQIEDMGGDPTSLLPKDAVQTPPLSEFATKLDLARLEASKLAASDKELSVIMWYVEHRNLSVEEAHLLANKGKIKNAIQEITRAKNNVPPKGSDGTSGQRTKEVIVPELPKETISVLRKRGFTLNPKTGQYEAKYNVFRYNATTKQWVTEKKQ